MSKVQLVGIINVTPDSFSDGGKFEDVNKILTHAKELLSDGATILDVGAESTNPKSLSLTPVEEQKRLVLGLPELLKRYPNRISLDTYHPETVLWALQYGKFIVNDVSGMANPKMVKVIADHGVTCVMSHLPGDADGLPTKSHIIDALDDYGQIVQDTENRLKELVRSGIKPRQIIVDPGIGFGKTMRLNWELLEFAKTFSDYPVLIGASRKRFLGCDPKTGKMLPDGQTLRFSEERNVQAAEIAVKSGAAYLRVHEPAIYSSLV